MNEVERQYKFIKNCYDNCNGYNSNCGYYKQELLIHQAKNRRCSVYHTIRNDIKKIKDGKKNITYPVIEDIIKGIENDKKRK